MVAHPPPGGR